MRTRIVETECLLIQSRRRLEDWEFPPLEAGVPSEAIAVVAPKGGQGKTTIAINLATGLAEVAPNSVVLVDADLQFGDITAALALSPSARSSMRWLMSRPTRSC